MQTARGGRGRGRGTFRGRPEPRRGGRYPRSGGDDRPQRSITSQPKNPVQKMKAIQKQKQFYQKAKTVRKYKHLKQYLDREEKEQESHTPVVTPSAPTPAESGQSSFYNKLFFNQGLDERDQEELDSFFKQQYRRPKKEKIPQDSAVEENIQEEQEDETGGEGEREVKQEEENEGEEKKGKKKARPLPFYKEQKKWEEKQKEIARIKEEKQAERLRRKAKFKERMRKKGIMNKKTGKGQPLMSNLLNHYMSKLEK